MTDTKNPAFKRILLKLSGEALMGKFDYGIDPEMIAGVARDIVAISKTGIEVAIVIGGGNIFRGAGLAEAGMQRVSADHMGMLATVINSLSMQDAIQQAGKDCRVMSAVSMSDVCEDYTRRSAVRNLENSIICIFAAGTGNPFFTTDSAAALRASEIEADLMIKATKVDGVYDADPVKHPEATRYDELTFDEAIVNKLAVMDATAMVLCRDNNIPLRVFNMFNQGDLAKVVAGESIGTLVQRG